MIRAVTSSIAGGAALLILIAACGELAAQERPPEAPPSVVRPGPPGTPGVRLTAEDLQVPERPAHTEADVLFMRNMIHHHHQALVMSALAPERAQRDQVLRLARRIERAQADEIRLMGRWLELRGEEAPEVELEGLDDAHPHAHPGHERDHDEPLMAGMLTPDQLRDLAAARGDDFDRRFLELMIFHHQGAVEMVRELMASPGAAQDSDMFQFASHVKSDQMIEIGRMEEMLRRLDW